MRIHHNGAKQFRHPVVGELELDLLHARPAHRDPADLRLTIYTAEPGTPSEDAPQAAGQLPARADAESPSAAVTERP